MSPRKITKIIESIPDTFDNVAMNMVKSVEKTDKNKDESAENHNMTQKEQGA